MKKVYQSSDILYPEMITFLSLLDGVYSQMHLSRKPFRMIDDMLICPVILDDRMTGQNYLDFLQNELPKQLQVFL